MFGLGFQELLLVLVIVLILFGAGKLPKVMGDFGKGIKSFKSGLKEEDNPAGKSDPLLNKDASPTVDSAADRDRAANS